MQRVKPAKGTSKGERAVPRTFADPDELFQAVEEFATKHVRGLVEAAEAKRREARARWTPAEAAEEPDADRDPDLSDAQLKAIAREIREEVAPYENEKVCRAALVKLLSLANQQHGGGNSAGFLRSLAPALKQHLEETKQPSIGELRSFVRQVADPDSAGRLRWRVGFHHSRSETLDHDGLAAICVLAGFFERDHANAAIQSANRRHRKRNTGKTGATVADALEVLKLRDTIREILGRRQPRSA